MLMRTRSAGSFPVKRENRSSGFVNVHTKSAPSRDFYTSLQTLPGLRSILLVLLVVLTVVGAISNVAHLVHFLLRLGPVTGRSTQLSSSRFQSNIQISGCVPELDEVMGRPRALRALRRCTPAPEPCRVRLFRRTLKTRSLALEGAMAALALGAECAGEEAVLDHGKEYAPCDVAVVFDQPRPLGDRRVLETLMSEHGPAANEASVRISPPLLRRWGSTNYEDAGYVRVGVGGTSSADALYPRHWPGDDPGRRLDHMLLLQNLHLAHYRTLGDHVLLVLQPMEELARASAPLDRRSFPPHHHHLQWAKLAIRDIRKHSERPVVVWFSGGEVPPWTMQLEAEAPRVHVQTAGSSSPNSKPLPAVLKNCWAMVTFSSDAAVSALLAGVPVVAYDKSSPAWRVADRHARHVDNVTLFERRPWLEGLAASEYNRTELVAGVPWLMLRRILQEAGVCGTCPAPRNHAPSSQTSSGSTSSAGAATATEAENFQDPDERDSAADQGVQLLGAGEEAEATVEPDAVRSNTGVGMRRAKVLVFSSVALAQTHLFAAQIESHRCYARYHGYDYRLDQSALNGTRAAFRKVELAISHLQHYDTVMYLGPEVAVMGLESVPRMLRFISTVHMQDCHILFQDASALSEMGDIKGEQFKRFNVENSFFILKRTKRTQAFLRRWLEYREHEFVGSAWNYDQGPLVSLLVQDMSKGTNLEVCKNGVDDCLKTAQNMSDTDPHAGPMCAQARLSLCASEISPPRSFGEVCLPDIGASEQRYIANGNFKTGDFLWHMPGKAMPSSASNVTCELARSLARDQEHPLEHPVRATHASSTTRSSIGKLRVASSAHIRNSVDEQPAKTASDSTSTTIAGSKEHEESLLAPSDEHAVQEEPA